MDPTALKPTSRFAAPNRALSRSPSRSPSRRLQSHELDPLLSNLSPTSTLEALEATQAVGSGEEPLSSILRDSVAAATTSERALGIRAALAAKKTREWYNELMAWPWLSADGYHNGFDGQGESGHMGKYVCPKRLDELWPNGERLGAHSDAEKEVYCGSLPESVVQEYEDRIETISDDMDTLELDELKDYIRNVHLSTGSRRSSLQVPELDSGHVSTYNRLDDFTAVITATIMQALPTMTQLYLLLDNWSVRLMVLRRVPDFLACLEESRMAIKSAWNAVGKSEITTGNPESLVSRKTFMTMRTVLESRITELGRILDSMLDMLEGRQDILPEKWVDSMENLEIEFGAWVMETENQVLKNELTSRQSGEAIEAIDQTDYEQNPEKQDPPRNARTFGDQSSHEPPEPDLGRETGNTSETLSSDRSASSATQGHEHSDRSDMEPNESYSTAQGTVNMLNDSYPRSPLQNPPSGTFLAYSGSPEIKTTSAGNALDLSSGLLGYENPSQEIPSRAALTSTSSQTRERSVVGTDGTKSPRGDVHAVKVASGSTVSPQNLATSKSLPVNAKLEILDTLEAELLEQKHGPAARPGPLIFHKSHSRALSNVSSDMSSNPSYPGSATSEYFSNMPSPEIRDASRAEYFAGPIKVTTPSYSSKDPMSPDSTVSRQSSQRTERGDYKTNEGIFPPSYTSQTTHRIRASTSKSEIGANDIAGFKDGFFPSPGQFESESRAQSASIMSVEAAPKIVVRNDGTKGNENYSAVSPGLRHSQNEYLGSGQPLMSALLRLQEDESTRTTPEKPVPPFELNNTYKSALGSRSKKYVKDSAYQPSSDSSPPIPLKSRHRFEDVADLGPGSTPIRVRQRNRADPSVANIATPKSVLQSSNKSPTRSSDDQLEARITSILTDIPAHIRLTSGPEADAPEVFRPEDSQDPQTPATGPPTMRLLRSQSSVPSPPMTLAPAHPRSSKVRAQNGDPEIKLYHLHQSGKAAPIKLYIRLVGENGERVMVRIGGGWADLGEYLKEYAGHHGRRSVSDGRFEIQGFPQSQSSSPITALTGHSSAHDTPRSRPNSPSMLNSRNRRLSELPPFELKTPMTPDSLAYARQNSTPKSRDSSPASMRPSSRQSWTEDDPPLGLAGPRIRKVEISPRKQAWVDGMVDQARNTSAEKKKGGEGDFGDLGKVGGTKRLFLKSKKDG